MKQFFSFVSILLFFSFACSKVLYFDSSNGSDSNDCTSSTAPCQNLKIIKGLSTSNGGVFDERTKIFLSPSNNAYHVYNELLNIPKSTDHVKLEIKGISDENGEGPSIIFSSTEIVQFCDQSTDVTEISGNCGDIIIEDLVVDGVKDVYFSSFENVVIRRCEFSSDNVYIQVSPSAVSTLEVYESHFASNLIVDMFHSVKFIQSEILNLAMLIMNRQGWSRLIFKHSIVKNGLSSIELPLGSNSDNEKGDWGEVHLTNSTFSGFSLFAPIELIPDTIEPKDANYYYRYGDTFVFTCEEDYSLELKKFAQVKIYIDDRTVFLDNSCAPDSKYDYPGHQGLRVKECPQKLGFMCNPKHFYFFLDQPLFRRVPSCKIIGKWSHYRKFCSHPKYTLQPGFLVAIIMIQLVFYGVLLICSLGCVLIGVIGNCVFIRRRKRSVFPEEVGDGNPVDKKDVEMKKLSKEKSKISLEQDIENELLSEKRPFTLRDIVFPVFRVLGMLAYLVVLEVFDGFSLYLSLSEFFYRPSPIDPSQITTPTDCGDPYPSDVEVCKLFRLYNQFDGVYLYSLIFSIIIISIYAFFEVVLLAVFINTGFLHVLTFLVRYLAFKEWLVHRIIASSCYFIIMLAGGAFTFNKFYFWYQRGIAIGFLEVVNVCFLEVILFSTIVSIWKYNGMTCHRHLLELFRLRKNKEQMPDIDINLSFFVSNPHDMLENVFFTVALADTHKEISQLRQMSRFGNFKWNFISGLTKDGLERLENFFMEEDTQENRHSTIFWTSPLTKQWWKALIPTKKKEEGKEKKPSFIKRIGASLEKFKSTIQSWKWFQKVNNFVLPIFMFIMLSIKEVYDVWMCIFVFINSREVDPVATKFESSAYGSIYFKTFYDYAFYYSIVFMAFTQGVLFFYRLLWIRTDIFSTVKFLLSYNLFREWLPYRVTMSLTYIMIMVFGYLLAGFIVIEQQYNFNYDYSKLRLPVKTSVIIAEIFLFIKILKTLGYDGIGCLDYARKLSQNKNVPTLDISLVDVILNDPQEILEEIFLTLLVSDSVEDMQKKKELASYSHFVWKYTEKMSQEDFEYFKKLFFEKEQHRESWFEKVFFRKPFPYLVFALFGCVRRGGVRRS